MVSSSTLPRRQTSRRWPLEQKWQAGIIVVLLILVAAAAVAFTVTRKAVTISADGTIHRVVTHRSTVAALFKDNNIQLATDDEVIPALDAKLGKNEKVTVYRAVEVTIKADGQSRPFRTAKTTVKAALTHAGVKLGQLDFVDPAVDSPVIAGLKIVVHRVEERTVVETVAIAFPVLRRTDLELEKGKSKIVQVGKQGAKERTFKLTFQDGKQIKRVLAGEKVVKDPVPQLVAVGTKKIVRTLITSRGTYRYNEVRTMVATAYDPGPRSVQPYYGGITRIGLKAGYGIVAVDPRVIPLRTRLYIPGYGEALAGDTGGAIKGDRIDLGYNTYEEAIRFGRRKITVYVLE